MLSSIQNFLYWVVRRRVDHNRVASPRRISRSTTLEGYNAIGRGTSLLNCKIGLGTYTGSRCAFANTTIGRFCSIASNVKLVCGRHPAHTFVSTYPAFYSPAPHLLLHVADDQLFEEYRYADKANSILSKIGNDVWIGENVCILDGVTIGDGAIIGAGAVVVADVPPYQIYGGVPAKCIRSRFAQNEIDFLLSFRWWNKELEWIRRNAGNMTNIATFIDKCQEASKTNEC